MRPEFRQATLDDLEHILNQYLRFSDKTWMVYGIPVDGQSAKESAIELINRGICLVGPESFAGALIYPCMWNKHARIATVILWCFSQAREIAIFEALMQACRERGATHISAASVASTDAISRYYAKKGLFPAEHQFICPL